VTITEFLAARIGEAQERAEAMGHYTVEDDTYVSCPGSRTEPHGDLPWGEDACDCGLAERKARAFREVEFRRKIIALHGPNGNPLDEWYGSNVRCTECGGYNLVPGYGAMGYSRPWPCKTLLALAAIDSDHPDFDRNW
jgi:hypothetical protein